MSNSPVYRLRIEPRLKRLIDARKSLGVQVSRYDRGCRESGSGLRSIFVGRRKRE